MRADLDAVLFDMDGVLVDSRDAIARSINHALATRGMEPVDEPRLHALIGAPLPGVFEDLLREQGGDPALAGSCVQAYRRRYGKASLEETVPIEGIPDVVDALARRYRLAVATTKPAEYALPILEALGLADRFEAVFGSPLHTERSEEKQVTIGRALEALGLSRAAMVGDRHFDVVGGRAHDLFTIGVTWGAGSESELIRAGADALVHTPAQLLDLLDGRP